MSANILIVDDSKPVRDVIRKLLEIQTGLTVCGEAEDGIEAIRKAEILTPDLVLLDLVMPKLNGAATARELRRISPKVPIILSTMFGQAAEALAPAVGVDVVLSKPDGLHNLVVRIRELILSPAAQE